MTKGRPLLVKHDEPTQRIVKVDSDQAKKWLLLNQKIRKIKGIKIAQYARDMREGNWRFTERRSFNTDGELIDGQNRLHAVIDSETAQSFCRHRARPECPEVMDSGPAHRGRRTSSAGYSTHGTRWLSHARYAEEGGHETPLVKLGSAGAPTKAEIVDYVRPTPVSSKHQDQQSGIAVPAASARRLRLLTMSSRHRQVAAKDFFESIVQLRTWGVSDPVNTLIRAVSRWIGSANVGPQDLHDGSHLERAAGHEVFESSSSVVIRG